LNMAVHPAISVRMTKLRDQQIAWLDHIKDKSGLTITEIARAAKLDPSTLTRFVNRNDKGHSLSTRTVKKIEDATRVPAYETRTKPIVQSFSEEEGQPYIAMDDPSDIVGSALGATAKAARNIHLWTLKTSSLAAMGYLPGMIVAVDEKTPARNGDCVCAQKYDFRRGTAETIFRVFRTPYLLTAHIGGEPALPEIVDNENVVIMGTVVGGFRLRH
jgi:SOS-response transcriptional repressor LexA